MSRYFKHFRWTHLIVIGAMLLATMGFTAVPIAQTKQSTCGTTYTVQSGDSLSSIAKTCNTTVNALEQANPQIINPGLIYPGEALNLPSNVIPVTGPQVQIIPASGQAGTKVKVSGTGFPASSTLNVTVAQQSASPVSTATVNTNSNGNFTTQVTIPSSAQAGSTWTLTAATQTSGGPSASANFQVVVQPTTGYYTVQSGDTLSSLAQRFNTSVNALLRANPQITNPNQLTPGQQILLPGSLAVIPNTGQPVYVVKQGDSLSVIAANLGISESTLLSLNPQITNPSLIYPGEVLNLPAGIIPVTGPQMQITPSSGQAGTQVTVSGTAFPANSTLKISITQQGGSPVSTTTVNTNSSGNFTTQVTISSSAQAGSTWIITAATQASGGPSASAQFAVIAESSNGTYTVQPGDTLTGLAQRFGISVEMLLQANSQLNKLSSGQTINIPARIHFAPGATSQVIQGKLAANSSQFYMLYAQANQLLQVTLTPQSGLNLSIYGANGNELKSSTSGGASFRGSLPSSQYYILGVSSGNSSVSYNMDVNIPARISFASGATSASVNGRLPANGNQYYILNAQKNQNMQVRVTPQQGVKLTVYGVDGTVLQSGMSGAASFNGSLPSTQDYILVLSSTNSSGSAISYTLQVSIISPQSVIPNTGQTVYIVQQGDTLSQIAKRFGTTTSALLQANPQITNPSLIFPGERIVIPGSNS